MRDWFTRGAHTDFASRAAAHQPHAALRYGVALVGAVGASALTLWAQSLLQHTIFAVYIAMVVAVAWFAGLGPALLAIALAMIAATLVVVPEFGVEHPLLPAIVYGGVGLLIAWMSVFARRGEYALRIQSAELQEQAMELEQQMEAAQAVQVELEVTNDQLETTNQELERIRIFLEQAQASARLGSWEWDVVRNEVSWSDELFRVYGLEPGSIPVSFDSFLERVHPEDRQMVSDAVQRSFQTQEPFQFDHRIVLPDGQVRWLEGKGRVVLDTNGQPVRMMGSGQDITERRRASEAQRFLAEAGEALAGSLDYETTLRTVAGLAVRELADWCAVAIGDSTGSYQTIAVAHRDEEKVRWAEEWTRHHRAPPDSQSGVPAVLRSGQPKLLAEIPVSLLRQSARSEEEVRILEQLGLRSAMIVPMISRERVLGAITFVSAESGYVFAEEDLWLAERLAARAAVAIDNARLLREAQDARAAAENANRAKMDFLAAMSHELRTPLNAIAGYAELLEIGVPGEINEEQRAVLGRLQRNQRHLLGLVDEVLGFARIEAGKLELSVGDVAVGEILSRASEMTGPQLQAKNLTYVANVADAQVMVRADGERVQQIVVNLLSNAVKFTAPGGRITLTCSAADGLVSISIADTGIGIPPDKLETVFEPFAQLPQPLEKRSSGVGLGLAISRDLARAMGGDVSVSSSVGAGSVFTLTLPTG